ncbi:MAG: hypothetical protein KDD06_20235 [Phaeodactylibacter sp.]|nr:hypothetical protein [Phaeodactylibacter sp.]
MAALNIKPAQKALSRSNKQMPLLIFGYSKDNISCSTARIVSVLYKFLVLPGYWIKSDQARYPGSGYSP